MCQVHFELVSVHTFGPRHTRTFGPRRAWHVCVLTIYFGDSPSDQGETRASLLSVFRGLHFAAYFSCPSKPTGVTQEGGEHWAFFFFFSLMSHLRGACLHFVS